MNIQFFLPVFAIFVTANIHAGHLDNGSWSPAGCGAKPPVPTVESSNVNEYNRSIKALNEWQVLAQKYYSCLVEEANADNALIANTANEAQSEFRAVVERINEELTKVDKQEHR
ncbi:MAG: hypothetical protein RQ714_07540 [Nitrosomonas sp.]|nr:hypothetical protein [Nitrosomonas sp.]